MSTETKPRCCQPACQEPVKYKVTQKQLGRAFVPTPRYFCEQHAPGWARQRKDNAFYTVEEI